MRISIFKMFVKLTLFYRSYWVSWSLNFTFQSWDLFGLLDILFQSFVILQETNGHFYLLLCIFHQTLIALTLSRDSLVMSLNLHCYGKKKTFGPLLFLVLKFCFWNGFDYFHFHNLKLYRIFGFHCLKKMSIFGSIL